MKQLVCTCFVYEGQDIRCPLHGVEYEIEEKATSEEPHTEKCGAAYDVVQPAGIPYGTGVESEAESGRSADEHEGIHDPDIDESCGG